MAKKVKNKIFLFPLALAVIFFASIIIIFSPVGKKNIIAFPTPTITPTPTPSPITWETYRNENYGFGFQYPSAFRIEENIEENFESISVLKDDYDFTIFPSNYLNVTFPIENWSKLQRQKSLTPCEKGCGVAGTLIYEKEVLIDDTKAYHISQAADPTASIEYYLINKNNQFFTIRMSVPYYDSNLLEIEEKILASFKFLPDTATWKTYKNKEHGFEFKYPSKYSVESPCNRMAGLFKYNWVICVFDPLIVEENIQNDTQYNSDLFYLGSTEGFRFKYNPESMSEIKKLQLGKNIFEAFYATMYEETEVFYYKIGNFLFINLTYNWHELNPDFDQILSTFKFLPDTSTREIGYIKIAYNKDNNNYIEMDYIEWLSDSTAPNGYRIKNDNPLLRTFEVTKSAPISLIDLTGPEITHQKSSFDNFISVINKNNSGLFWITLNSVNQVIEINEQYVP